MKKVFTFIKNEAMTLFKGTNSFYHNNKRVLILIVALYYIIYNIGIAHTVQVAITVPLFAASMAHLLRKILFPYLKLEKFVIKAQDDNSISAAMVVIGAFAFIATLIAAFCLLLFI